MLYPKFWQVMIVVVVTTIMTCQLLTRPGARKKYLIWFVGLGGASAMVAAMFGKHGDELSGAGSFLGLVLGFTAIFIAWQLYRNESGESAAK